MLPIPLRFIGSRLGSIRAGAVSALCLGILLSCQQSQPWDTPAKGIGAKNYLADVRLEDRFLDGRAFAAEAAFLFPEESRALVHALLRSEFAQLEARRLQLSISDAELDAAVEQSRSSIQGSLASGQTLDDWSIARFDRSWHEAQSTLRRHLADNQLYQLCARAHALEGGRVELQMLTTLDHAEAQAWARRIGAGASATTIAATSLDRGPNGDGTLPPLPIGLPGELGDWMIQQSGSGGVFGPFQFENETVWRVVLVLHLLPAEKVLPPKGILLEKLRQIPVSPLEERAWFEAMLKRYNAVENLPAIQAPAAAFVRPPS